MIILLIAAVVIVVGFLIGYSAHGEVADDHETEGP